MLKLFEQLIRRDPARRGLIASEPEFGPLAPGELALAVDDLTERGRAVALVTGFFIPRGTPPAAETDGPLGTLLLAEVLRRAGVKTMVITDRNCFSAVAAAARGTGVPFEDLVEYPYPQVEGESPSTTADWRGMFADRAQDLGLSHLIAIERVGPAHTVASLRAQSRDAPPPLEEFRRLVHPDCEGKCHNMRGEPIDHCAGDLHKLFQELPARIPGLRTIGVGDGANEIGMGSLLWENLARRLTGEQAGRVPCRIPCDWTIVAGVSNWGGYALAAGFAWRLGRVDLLARHSAVDQRRVLQALVAEGPAVDGVTRSQTATVDGLPFDVYIAPWIAMRQALGLAE